jgi:hypothetical protein
VGWLVVIWLCSAFAWGGVLQHDQIRLIKAGFIAKFPAFVEWPGNPIPGPSVLRFCTIGRPLLHKALEEVLRFSDMGEREPVLERIVDPAEAIRCPILYIAKMDAASLEAILDITRDRPILTVGDTEGYGEKGVLINLFVENRQVRFEINLPAVRRSGLSIDFRLLEVARLIGT